MRLKLYRLVSVFLGIVLLIASSGVIAKRNDALFNFEERRRAVRIDEPMSLERHLQKPLMRRSEGSELDVPKAGQLWFLLRAADTKMMHKPLWSLDVKLVKILRSFQSSRRQAYIAAPLGKKGDFGGPIQLLYDSDKYFWIPQAEAGRVGKSSPEQIEIQCSKQQKAKLIGHVLLVSEPVAARGQSFRLVIIHSLEMGYAIVMRHEQQGASVAAQFDDQEFMPSAFGIPTEIQLSDRLAHISGFDAQPQYESALQAAESKSSLAPAMKVTALARSIDAAEDLDLVLPLKNK